MQSQCIFINPASLKEKVSGPWHCNQCTKHKGTVQNVITPQGPTSRRAQFVLFSCQIKVLVVPATKCFSQVELTMDLGIEQIELYFSECSLTASSLQKVCQGRRRLIAHLLLYSLHFFWIYIFHEFG